MQLPTPECLYGYTYYQLESLLGDALDSFLTWITQGQTAALCDGRRYNREECRYEPTECASNPHGLVYYPWDVEQFLAGLPPLD